MRFKRYAGCALMRNIANQIHGFTIDYGKFLPKEIRLFALNFYRVIVTRDRNLEL